MQSQNWQLLHARPPKDPLQGDVCHYMSLWFPMPTHRFYKTAWQCQWQIFVIPYYSAVLPSSRLGRGPVGRFDLGFVGLENRDQSHQDKAVGMRWETIGQNWLVTCGLKWFENDCFTNSTRFLDTQRVIKKNLANLGSLSEQLAQLADFPCGYESFCLPWEIAFYPGTYQIISNVWLFNKETQSSLFRSCFAKKRQDVLLTFRRRGRRLDFPTFFFCGLL